MKRDIYSRHFEGSDINKIIDKFHETIINTNRGYGFFVDWRKVRDHVQQHKIEFNILNSLIGSKTFNDDLGKILSRYPEVLPVIPILIAIRDVKLEVIGDFLDAGSDIDEYDFEERELSSEDVKRFIEFFDKTGLKYFFQNMSSKSIQDYVTGVEVGMDTHARKNRSGHAMELAMKPIIDEIVEARGSPFKVLFQKKFDYLKTLRVPVPPALKDRKADFIIVKGEDVVINIEVNFYSGTGSKPQEIVDSYINRQSELKENDFHFIWVTDGFGWKGQKNQIRKGFQKIDYLLNLHFARRGLLREILCQI